MLYDPDPAPSDRETLLNFDLWFVWRGHAGEDNAETNHVRLLRNRPAQYGPTVVLSQTHEIFVGQRGCRWLFPDGVLLVRDQLIYNVHLVDVVLRLRRQLQTFKQLKVFVYSLSVAAAAESRSALRRSAALAWERTRCLAAVCTLSPSTC